MYLKELTLRGFKSFASATTLRFEPGITAVVGPNGSGKSNIVDALTWVMGEQGAKNLRGSSMEDVIFAGTSSRPPLGRAQVSLTIDNSDHALDIDYTEVTISRTIFRNGGSEYAINGSSCRLLDIQELLSDTGLGQQMHVIVGQGRLDAILKADPSGHRAFIEEAAGILKHRKRKERALRKLANTQANVDRLDDLLREIQRQLGPLGRQARISRRADSIQVSLRDAKSRIYAQDASVVMHRREQAMQALRQAREQLRQVQRDMARVNAQIEQVEALSAQANPDIDRADAMWHAWERAQERFRSVASLAQERAQSVRGQIAPPGGEDPQMLLRRADELEEQRRDQERQVEDERLALDKVTQERAEHERRLAAVRQTLTEVRKAIQQHDAHMAGLRELVAKEEGAVRLQESRQHDYAEQLQAGEEQLRQARDEVARLERQTHADEDDGGAALDAACETLARRQEELDAAQGACRQLDDQVIALQAKADALQDTLQARDANGVLRQDAKVGALGRLTDFLQVVEGWEEAVSHALEGYASAMVVPHAEALRYALWRACEDKLGKAAVLHATPGGDGVDHDEVLVDGTLIDGVGAGGESDDMPSLARMVTMRDGVADEHVARGVVASVRMLLRDAAAVQDMDQAWRAIEAGWHRAVTMRGEVLTAGVAAVGGSSLSHSELALAARRDKTLAQIKQANERQKSLRQDERRCMQARDEARQQVEQERAKRTEITVRARQAQQALQEAQQRVVAQEKRRDDIHARMAQAQEELRRHQAAFEDARQALSSAREDGRQELDLEALHEREHRLEQELIASREQETSAKIAWAQAARSVESLQRQIGLLRDNAQEAQRRRERVAQQNARRRERADKLERLACQARVIGEAAACCAQAMKNRREALRASMSEHDGRLRQLRAKRKEWEPQVAQWTKREHDLDIERERLAGEQGAIAQRIADELGLDVAQLVSSYGPDRPVPVLDESGQLVPLPHAESAQSGEMESQQTDVHASEPVSIADVDPSRYRTVPYVREEQEARLRKAERDLAALGKVNPLAAEEYDALQTRNQYLHDQRNDVVRSRDDLLTLIRDLDTTMVEVFKSAFEDTAQAFERVFATLFPGGRGRLRLENPDDLLTTGVLVEASPAGKRVKQLSLLSGGERSLTALALLLAIFTARPSPFYVMDEVEAALDDVNLNRLIAAFEDLREHAQLIVITHQQRTMGIADALYGVTMRADGITAVVSQRMADHNRESERGEVSPAS